MWLCTVAGIMYAYTILIAFLALKFKTVFCFRTKTLMLDRNLDKKGREKLMFHFIAVMKVHCCRHKSFVMMYVLYLQSLRQHNNFNAYLAILSAIESAPVSRLEWSERVFKVITNSFTNHKWRLCTCATCIVVILAFYCYCRIWRNHEHWLTTKDHSKHTGMLLRQQRRHVFHTCELIMCDCIISPVTVSMYLCAYVYTHARARAYVCVWTCACVCGLVHVCVYVLTCTCVCVWLVRVHVCVDLYVPVCVDLCMCVDLCVCVDLYVCLCMSVYVCVCTHIYACVYVCVMVCVHVCVNMCVNVCACICVYVHPCVYTWIHLCSKFLMLYHTFVTTVGCTYKISHSSTWSVTN